MNDDGWSSRTTDRLGRLVLLTEERWQHITRKHHEFDDVALILQAVRMPNLVTQDARHADRQCCYAFPPGDTRMVKVVVEYSGSGDAAVGDVITAYFTDRLPTNEVQRWP